MENNKKKNTNNHWDTIIMYSSLTIIFSTLIKNNTDEQILTVKNIACGIVILVYIINIIRELILIHKEKKANKNI